MLSSTVFAASLVTVAYAVQFDLDTNNPIVMTEGEPLTLNWSDADGAVTINLVTGSSTDLSTVFTITADRTTDSFTWTPEGIPSGTYAFEITDESGDVNYTPQYTYQSTGVTATTSAAASTTTADEEETSTSAATTTKSDDDEETSTAAATTTAEPTETDSEEEPTETAEPTTMATMSSLSNSTASESDSASSTGSESASPTADEANADTTDIVNANSGARFGTSLAAAMGVVAVFAFLN